MSDDDGERRMDPRVRRSRQALIDALLALAQEMPLSEVTVSAVAARAGVSRVTFYERFPTLDDLLVAAMQASISEVRRAAASIEAPGGREQDEPPEDLVRVFTVMAEHAPLYRATLSESGSMRFFRRLRDSLGEAVVESLRRVPGGGQDWVARPETYVDFVTGAALSVAMGWMDSSEQQPPEQIAREFWLLLTRGSQNLQLQPGSSAPQN